HWSLPRALSRAELAAREELGGLEARAASLQAQWQALAGRARRLCEERRAGAGQGVARGAVGVRVSSVPPAQLEKVHDAVVGQYRGLSAARAALSSLEQQVGRAAAERTAEQLER
ncbi:hypothetical protein Agub_g13267, partial [Astrephomene gubernaculifera]